MSDLLEDLKVLLRSMSPEDKAALDRQMAAELNSVFKPNPGPQTDALLSRADIVLFGGSAGGGKSALEMGLAAEHRRAIVFRRESTQVDGLVEIGKAFYSDKAKFNSNDNEFVFLDRDCRVKLSGMQQIDDWRKHAGVERDLICFDEAGEFIEEQVSSVIAWNRSSVQNQRCRVILGSNPPRGSDGAWLLSWFAPWLDPLFRYPALPGELRWAVMVAGKTRWVDSAEPVTIDGESYEPLSRTFIPSRLDDNPFLKDTNYRSRLMALPEPLRSQLLRGDFEIGKIDAENQVIPSEWISAAQARWKPEPPQLRMLTLGCDPAQGGADRTVIATLYGTWFDHLIVREGVDTKNGPAVASLIVEARRDNAQISIDCTGGFGGSARDHLEGMGVHVLPVIFSAGADERTRDDTLEFANVRAQLYWQLREALDPFQGDNIALPPDRKLAAELGAATWKIRGTRILIESKDEIRKRLGVSPDLADAVCLAWHKRSRALFMQQHGSKLAKEWAYAVEQTDPFDS